MPHYFYCPLPTSPVGNNRCALMCVWGGGAQEKLSERAHQKIFVWRFAPALCPPPHLQIASNATGCARIVTGVKAAAAVNVGTYSSWESTGTLRLLGGTRGAWAPTGRTEAGALCRHAHVLFDWHRGIAPAPIFWFALL